MTVTRINACAVQHQGGQAEPFCYERRLGENDVLVRVTHCSIARGDIQFIDNDWGDTRFPLVPGHQIVGLIEDTGSPVTGLMVGDRVGIGYQQEACFSCEFCKGGHEQFCPQQKVIGIHCYGGLADHIAVDGRFAFKLPPALDPATAAPLMSSGLTVYTAIVGAGLPDASEVAVLGVGGLGHLAIEFLREMRHRVSALSHSPAKREIIERLGARYIDSSRREGLKAYTKRFDYILSTVNASFDLNAYLGMLRPQGKLCVVAQPLEQVSIGLGALYDNAQRTIYGSYVGSRKDMRDMLAFAAEHNIEDAVHIMPFADVNEAIATVRRAHTPTRVVLQR
jgi:D-arabinose 1-dehydrogenase-like Zn-dependent alcohol dehydrogenase